MLVVVIACCNIAEVRSYCIGGNPGFDGPPKVEQVDMTSVLVSWNGIVTRIDCADNFLIKSWDYMNPNDYKAGTTFCKSIRKPNDDKKITISN